MGISADANSSSHRRASRRHTRTPRGTKSRYRRGFRSDTIPVRHCLLCHFARVGPLYTILISKMDLTDDSVRRERQRWRRIVEKQTPRRRGQGRRQPRGPGKEGSDYETLARKAFTKINKSIRRGEILEIMNLTGDDDHLPAGDLPRYFYSRVGWGGHRPSDRPYILLK